MFWEQMRFETILKEQKNNCSKSSIFYLQAFKLAAFCRLAETLGMQFPLDRKRVALKIWDFPVKNRFLLHYLLEDN